MSAGPDAALLEELQQPPVAFVNTTDHIVPAWFGVGEQQQTPAAPAAGTLQLAEVAVRTRTSAPQLGQQFGLEIRGYGMLQTLRLVVDLVPFHAKHF